MLKYVPHVRTLSIVEPVLNVVVSIFLLRNYHIFAVKVVLNFIPLELSVLIQCGKIGPTYFVFLIFLH
jgi:hypothetical protein